MSNNHLTPQEKQMPTIRLPLRIAVFAWADLFAAIVMCMIMLAEDNIPGLIACLIVLGVPALIGLTLYSNHMIRFDKDNIVYRDFARRVHRFTFADIVKIEDNGRITHIFTEKHKIIVNDKGKLGQWFMELAGKKRPAEDEKKALSAEERNEKFHTGLGIIIMAVCFLFFFVLYLWITFYSPNTRILRNCFLVMAFFGIAGLCTAIRDYKAFGKDSEYKDGTPKGFYLLNAKGKKVTGKSNPKLIAGFLLLCLGAILNVIYPLLYAASAFCFLAYFRQEYKIKNLHRAKDAAIEKVWRKYRPSRDLKAKLEQAGKSIPADGAEYRESSVDDDDTLFDRLFYWIPTLVGIFFLILISCNVYLHDSRFEKTTEIDMSFRMATYDDSALEFTKERFGMDYILIPTDDELAEYYVFIKGFDLYGQNQNLLEDRIDGKTVFRTVSVYQDGGDLQILQIEDPEGNILLSLEECKQRKKDIAVLWLRIFAGITLISAAGGALLTMRKKRKGNPAPKEETEESFDREGIKTSTMEGSRLYRYNFFSSNIMYQLGGFAILAWALVLITLVFLPFPELKEDQMVSYELTVADYGHDTNKLQFKNWLDLYDKEDHMYSISHFDRYGKETEAFYQALENGETFTIRGGMEDWGIHVYSITDQTGTEYYSLENARKAEQYSSLGDLVFFGVPGIVLGILAITYLLLLRYLDKMPRWIVDLMLTAEYPTQKLIDALPDSYGRVKEHAIKKHQKWNKVLDHELDKIENGEEDL